MFVTKPPMGWNSWNTFGHDINETVVKETADKLVSSGLAAAGYEYVVIDDCWSLRERDENGRLVADPAKFPSGMKAIAAYIHSLGLKFGMYSDAGHKTCANYPGSFDHEFIDAETFASWGVDYLKYDYCWLPKTISGDLLFKRMGAALANCGRDILFSACTGGRDNTKEWIHTTGAHMWRTTRDILDNYHDMKELITIAHESFPYGGINCFRDMDMLIVGMHGEGNVGMNGCTDDEYRLHFSAWALCASPLMIGCDIRKMDDETLKTLTNPEVLKIDQDPACHQPFDLNDGDPDHPVLVRQLENGDYAIGIFNLSDEQSWACSTNLSMDRLGMTGITGRTLKLTELWTGEEAIVRDNIFAMDMQPHTFRLYRARVQKI